MRVGDYYWMTLRVIWWRVKKVKAKDLQDAIQLWFWKRMRRFERRSSAFLSSVIAALLLFPQLVRWMFPPPPNDILFIAVSPICTYISEHGSVVLSNLWNVSYKAKYPMNAQRWLWGLSTAGHFLSNVWETLNSSKVHLDISFASGAEPQISVG